MPLYPIITSLIVGRPMKSYTSRWVELDSKILSSVKTSVDRGPVSESDLGSVKDNCEGKSLSSSSKCSLGRNLATTFMLELSDLDCDTVDI